MDRPRFNNGILAAALRLQQAMAHEPSAVQAVNTVLAARLSASTLLADKMSEEELIETDASYVETLYLPPLQQQGAAAKRVVLLCYCSVSVPLQAA